MEGSPSVRSVLPYPVPASLDLFPRGVKVLVGMRLLFGSSRADFTLSQGVRYCFAFTGVSGLWKHDARWQRADDSHDELGINDANMRHRMLGSLKMRS
jgi:hypothetical protein